MSILVERSFIHVLRCHPSPTRSFSAAENSLMDRQGRFKLLQKAPSDYTSSIFYTFLCLSSLITIPAANVLIKICNYTRPLIRFKHKLWRGPKSPATEVILKCLYYFNSYLYLNNINFCGTVRSNIYLVYNRKFVRPLFLPSLLTCSHPSECRLFLQDINQN